MKYNYNEDLFRQDSEAKYYIVGLILADGYIAKDLRRIEIALKESDKDYLELIKNMICPSKSLKYKPKQQAYRFTLDNVNIVTEVMKYVSNRRKSESLLFPYGIPDKYLLDFMRGYSDGDGNISVKRGQRKFPEGIKYYYGLRYRILGQRDFLEGLSFNLKRLGVAKNQVNPHRKGRENVFYIEYGFSAAERVLDALYSNATLKLDHKYQVYKAISEADSDQLSNRYNTKLGHYNMHGAELLSAKV